MSRVEHVSLELARVSKRYGAPASGKLAVDDVSFAIHEGERVGVIGRNGAGKSTLLELIGGLSDASGGMLRVNGHVTAVMTLGVGLREDLSGRENIYVDGEIQGKSRAEIDRVIDDIVEFAELGEFIEYPVRTYSTGMKSRLAFAMISHLDPEILIIDEALSAGDAKFSLKASARIHEICDRGRIVIVVSHSMESIRQICNRCIWLDAGRIVRDGAPEEVTAAYVDAVHRQDEAELVARFRKLVGARTLLQGYAIDELAIVLDNAAERAVVVECGKNVSIRLRGTTPETKSGTALRLEVSRVDGLKVIDESREISISGEGRARGAFDAEIGMRPLVLGPGVFRALAQIVVRGQVAAEQSTVFEVYAAVPPIGGRPALIYPVGIESARRPGVPGVRT